MVLPDEGGARWPADCALAVRVYPRTSIGISRNVLRLYALSGSGTAHVDWGDGTSDDVALPGSAAHTYASSGTYVAMVTGDVTDARLSDGQVGGAPDLDSAQMDVLRMTCPVPAGGFYHMPPTGLLVSVGVRDWYRSSGGWPSRLVVQGVSGTLRFNAYMFQTTVFTGNLSEFYAPSVTGFSAISGTGNLTSSRSPFAGCGSLTVLYLPSVASIPFSCFVSPDASGVKVYVGRLTSANAQAFTNRSPSDGSAIVSGNPASPCRAELFCKNTSSEIVALGFPFGAEYLKCHCTDMTFDSLGYRFRADGRRYDPENGQLVNDDFRYVNEAGHLVKYHEGLAQWLPCDEYGFYVDDDDLPIDPVTGFWIDREGHVCDAHGRKCDTLGNLVDYKYWNPGSVDDSMQPAWYADDNYGEPGNYMNGTVAEYGPYWQYVVDRLGGKVAARGNVNLDNGLYESDDPRCDMWSDGVLTDDGYIDYYDAKGFLRARERSYEDGGAVYSVVYDGGREWHLELYSSGEGG
jgi:hypothetical protein